jgi:hypothetical protein
MDGYVLRRAKAMRDEVGIIEFQALMHEARVRILGR